jgi:hypothetical protein
MAAWAVQQSWCCFQFLHYMHCLFLCCLGILRGSPRSSQVSSSLFASMCDCHFQGKQRSRKQHETRRQSLIFSVVFFILGIVSCKCMDSRAWTAHHASTQRLSAPTTTALLRSKLRLRGGHSEGYAYADTNIK